MENTIIVWLLFGFTGSGGRDNHETTKSLLGNLQKTKRKVVSMDDTDKIATTKDGRNQKHNNLLYRNL